MKYLVTLVVVACAASWAAGQSCHLRELDLCAATGIGNNKISTTESDVDKQCAVMAETRECFGNFTKKCTTPIQREIVGFITEGANDVSKRFCTRGDTLRTEYLKHAPCLVRTQPEGKKCLKDVQTGLEKIEESKFQDRISTACCVYARYNTCSTKAIEGTCGKAAVEYGNVLVKLATSNLLDVVCNGYDRNPVCNTLLPPPGTRPRGNSKSVVSRLFNAYVQA